VQVDEKSGSRAAALQIATSQYYAGLRRLASSSRLLLENVPSVPGFCPRFPGRLRNQVYSRVGADAVI
jgi:hypothetical protein